MTKRRSDARKAKYRPDTALGLRHEKIGEDDCPYLERWVCGLGLFAVRLHHFFRSDEDDLHDHPWPFVTLVLKGGYLDVTEDGGEPMSPGTIRYRPALHKHRVVTDGCWTLVLSARKQRDWGFYVHDGWLAAREYFKLFGNRAREDC